jgi:aarF domain-containing kinase
MARPRKAISDRLAMGVCVGNLDANAPRRAAEVRGAIERLGPAYVKVAQAVSTRVDLLSPAYLTEIERLQDRVPPFPTSEV